MIEAGSRTHICPQAALAGALNGEQGFCTNAGGKRQRNNICQLF